MQTKIFIFICCCFFCVVGSAQNVVSGQITVSGGITLAGSHIHIGKKTVSSDVSGNYTIRKLPTGNIKVFVSYVGYKSVETPATSFRISPRVWLLNFSIVSVLIFCSKIDLFSVLAFCLTTTS